MFGSDASVNGYKLLKKKELSMFRIILASCLISVVLLQVGCDKPDGTTAQGDFNYTGLGKDLIVEITPDNFRQVVIESETPVLVDFWAPWCGPCVQLTPTIEKVAEKFEGKLRVVKVNVDDNQDLSEEFQVTSIPRLIYFHKGEVVIRDGARDPASMEKEIGKVVGMK